MTKKKLKIDAEMDAFEASLLRSIDQMQGGEHAAVHTPGQIAARREGRPVGRPTGSIKSAPKVPTTIRLSPEVSAAFRATGNGWQTRIDAALKDWLSTHSPV
jgi:uncharacterized protein (DUF4415 family)